MLPHAAPITRQPHPIAIAIGGDPAPDNVVQLVSNRATPSLLASPAMGLVAATSLTLWTAAGYLLGLY